MVDFNEGVIHETIVYAIFSLSLPPPPTHTQTCLKLTKFDCLLWFETKRRYHHCWQYVKLHYWPKRKLFDKDIHSRVHLIGSDSIFVYSNVQVVRNLTHYRDNLRDYGLMIFVSD